MLIRQDRNLQYFYDIKSKLEDESARKIQIFYKIYLKRKKEKMEKARKQKLKNEQIKNLKSNLKKKVENNKGARGPKESKNKLKQYQIEQKVEKSPSGRSPNLSLSS